jgi:hypothetical protein
MDRCIQFFTVVDEEVDQRTMSELTSDEVASLPIYMHYFGLDDHPLSLDAVDTLAASMVSTEEPAGGKVPAGYTYLSQFIFHDLTWLSEEGGGTKNKASSALDMDSLLGNRFTLPDPPCPGSNDALRVGMTHNGEGSLPPLPWDVPRKPRCVAASDEDRRPKGFPLVPDLRNEGFLQLAQTHVVFLKFYNAVARHNGYGGSKFNEAAARREFVQHVQSVVLFDLLETLAEPLVYEDVVIRNARRVIHPDAVTKKSPFLIPIEFAAAAARYGHSMVRQRYAWNSDHDDNLPADLVTLITTSWQNGYPGSPQLGKLARDWVIDWERFFDFSPLIGAGARTPVPANPISPRITETMGNLPAHIRPLPSGGKSPPVGSTFSVSRATLRRQVQFQMVSAQKIIYAIEHMKDAIPIERSLTPDELAGPPGPTADAFRKFPELAEKTPIWFYVLREAEVLGGGERLGPLGSRLIAETLHAAVEAAGQDSLVANPGWKPSLPCHGSRFMMTDLIAFASA